MSDKGSAPGAPGLEPRWTSSAKSGVGTAYDARSRVWFTLSHGIVNEVYYPRVDQANTRDLGLLVTDGGPLGKGAFFSEEKRHTRSETRLIAPGVPGYRLTNECIEGRYRILKTVITDPERDVLLQHIRFMPLVAPLGVYRIFALLAPHIDNQGAGNDGWIGDYKGVPMLFARRGDTALALACSAGWSAASCGYVGASDGWQEVREYKRLVHRYPEVRGGNIALTGEIDLLSAAHGGRPPDATGRAGSSAADGEINAQDNAAEGAAEAEFVLALGFGRSPAEAGQRARMSLALHSAQVEESYVREWASFHARSLDLGKASSSDLYRASTAIIETHEDKSARGGIIASLSIPWGQSKGDHDLGGYHLVWPRDLVESAGALLAAGHVESARRTLRYLMSTQEQQGHWPQNMWLDGTPYWSGIQMDETAFPILLADVLRRADALGGIEPWPMVRAAAAYLVRNGPVTPQDRWEEDGGYSPFTLAVEVAALLAAADFAGAAGEPATARYLRETADAWNEGIERWTYVTDTALAHQVGVEGYYARIAPPEVAEAASPAGGFVPIKNRPLDQGVAAYDSIVSPDALALVRFGLRAADDPRIVNTLRVIDTVLRVETRTGPVWHRYNQDGYGEHEDGSPFDGTGVGRGWPLLAGERAHYELAAGRADEARRLADVMRAQASEAGLIPEQVWDAADIPALELCNGSASGSAMPLVWAHAEYVKLIRSLHDGRVFDTPPQTVARYAHAAVPARIAYWSPNNKPSTITTGQLLRVQTLVPVTVHWSADDWRTVRDEQTADVGLGVWHADLSMDALPPPAVIRFTLFWRDEQRWQGEDYAITITDAPLQSAQATAAHATVARDVASRGIGAAHSSR